MTGNPLAVLHPQADAPPGRARPPGPAQAVRLPRRRRPGMIALAVALSCAGIVATTSLVRSAGHRVPVVMVTAPVPAGATITEADLGTTEVAAGPGVSLIPASQLAQVPGHVAATALSPRMLLVPADLTTTMPPAAGQVLVTVPARPAILPASGLSPGDHVLVIATPGAAGQAGSFGASPEPPTWQVPATVEAVGAVPNQDGLDVVDLLVAAQQSTAVARQASTGQFALLVTSRTP